MYYWLANLVATLHGILVVCVIAGAAAAIAGKLRRNPRLEIAYYGILAMLILSDRLLGECFLTGCEQALRNLDRPGSAYRESFIGRYFTFLPPFVHARIGPALVVAAITAAPFWRILDRIRRRTSPAQAGDRPKAP